MACRIRVSSSSSLILLVIGRCGLGASGFGFGAAVKCTTMVVDIRKGLGS
jgi:hypothetical protein